MAATTTVAVASFAIYLIVGPNAQPEIEVTGTLQPGDEPTPHNSCGGTMPLLGVGGPPQPPPDALKIFIGSNVYVSPPGFSKVTAIQIGVCPVLTMERTPKGIEIGADLYGSDGQLIARITDNEFHAIQGSNSTIERQHSLTTLVVRDGKGAELLYVRYLNPTTIRARGIFGCPGHETVAFTDDGQIGASIITANSCFGVRGAAVVIK